MSFGEHLVAVREKQGVSRRRLGELASLSLSYLHEIETGEYLPGSENVRKIARALKLNVDDLVAERDRIEFERMGLDPDAAILLKQLGKLSDRERQRAVRLFRRIQAERRSNGS